VQSTGVRTVPLENAVKLTQSLHADSAKLTTNCKQRYRAVIKLSAAVVSHGSTN
jgi:hypothetical protein